MLLPLVASCFHDADCPPTEVEDNSVVVSFYISGSSLPNSLRGTRATDAITNYENNIDVSSLKLFFKNGDTNIELLNLRITKQGDEDLYYVLADIEVPGNLLGTPQEYRMEVFANCGDAATYDSNLTYQYDRAKFAPSADAPTYIPMWGVTTQSLTLELGKRSEMGTIHLLRSIAKIELNLVGEVIGNYKFCDIALSNYNQSGYMLPANPNNIAQTVSSPDATNIPSATTSATNLAFYINADSTKAYVYLPEYLATSGLNYSIDILNLYNKKTSTFSLSFNPNSVEKFNTIVRNHIYRYHVTGINDTEEIECTYTIKDWASKETNVESEDFHWLWVKDDILYMSNVSSIKTIFDSSTDDLTYTIDNVKIYKEDSPWPNGANGISVQIDEAYRGNITINSSIPTNYLGKEFYITVSSKISGKSAQIKVCQFPALYLSIEKTAVKWSDSSGQYNSSMYVFTALLPNLSGIPYPDQEDQHLGENSFYNYCEREWSWASLSYSYFNPRWDLGQTYTDYLRANCAFGFPQTTTTSRSNFYSSATSNASSIERYAGPIDLLTTVNSVENNRLISPRFALASQAGMNSPGSSYSSFNDYCMRYREYSVIDGVTYDYGPGTWRAPTKAEVYLIDVLQNVQACAVNAILEGGAYWSADEQINIMMDPRTGNELTSAAIRCVRDIK